MIRYFVLLALILAASGCRNEAADRLQSGKVMNLVGLEGRWAGPVIPTADGCGQTTTGLMTVGRNTFAFDPFQGTTVINGAVSDTGGLDGTLSRPGNGQQVISISFSGMARQHGDGEATIDGQLVSGHCTWMVNLKRG